MITLENIVENTKQEGTYLFAPMFNGEFGDYYWAYEKSWSKDHKDGFKITCGKKDVAGQKVIATKANLENAPMLIFKFFAKLDKKTDPSKKFVVYFRSFLYLGVPSRIECFEDEKKAEAFCNARNEVAKKRGTEGKYYIAEEA